MKWAGLAALAMLSINAKAFDLHPNCHQLYEMFGMPNISYEDVGKIADSMHENNCWPALQGLLADGSTKDTTNPVSSSCGDLAADITNQMDHIARIYGAQTLDLGFCESRGVGREAFQMAAIGYVLSGKSVENDMTNAEFHAACGLMLGATAKDLRALTLIDIEQPGRPDRVMDCTGIVYPDNTAIHFYLDRFPDGEQLWSYEVLQ